MNKPRSVAIVRAVVVGASLLLAAPLARADAPVTAAEHAKRAQVAYDVQNWSVAIQEFQAAYQAEQKPEFLWGLAQTQRLSGDPASAIKTYKAFKRADVTTSQANAAEMMITKCEAEVEKKEAEAAARKAAEAPPPQASTPAQQQPQEAPRREEPPAYKPFYADVFGDVLLVAGLGGVGVGAYFLLKGNSDMKASSSSALYRDYDTKVEDAETKQTVGAIVLSAGGALVGCAIVRYLTMSHTKETRTGLLVGPSSVGYAGEF